MKYPFRVHLQTGRATSLRSMMEMYIKDELERRLEEAFSRKPDKVPTAEEEEAFQRMMLGPQREDEP